MFKLKRYTICKSLSSQIRGLMFSKKKNLIFSFNNEQRVSLHMFFVFFPIWAVYLNKKKEAVFIKKLYPFVSFCYPKEKAKFILELINKPKIKLNQKVVW